MRRPLPIERAWEDEMAAVCACRRKGICSMINKLKFGPLPDISFVGGGEFSVEFLMKDTTGAPFDAEGCTAEFRALCRHGGEVIEGTTEVISDEDGIFSVLQVTVPAEATKKMQGEYVYQISLTDLYGESYEPMQGRMRVAPYIPDGAEDA